MKKIIFLSICLLLFPLGANASENVYFNCPKTLKQNEEVTCVVTGNSSFPVSGIEIKFTIPGNIEKVDFIPDKSFQGDEEKNRILLYTDVNKSGVFNIGLLKIKAKDNVNNFKVINNYTLFTDEEFMDHIIIQNVKDVESKIKKETRPILTYIGYGMILLIIVGGLTYIVIKNLNRSDRL